MIVIGIDENGLGPLLGPMVVTATAFRAPSADPERLWSLRGADLPADDSKVLFSRNSPARGELAFLKWLQVFNLRPVSAVELHRGICLPAPLPRLLLPTCHSRRNILCTPPDDLKLPLWADEADFPSELSPEIRRRFSEAGITPYLIRAFSLCPCEFNAITSESGMNKLRLDFELMIRLILHISQQAPGEKIHAICGKVGGTRGYLPWFNAMSINHVTVLAERPECSAYRIGDALEVQFVRDGDASHLPVAVSSMIGKYLREIEMRRINDVLRPNGKEVSGYRDRLTAEFVTSTSRLREQLGIADSCFLRNS